MSAFSDRAKKVGLPAAQRLAEHAGTATAGLRIVPSFLICGAQRCGTTSMYKALRQHPAIMRPNLRKGVHYFDVGHDNGFSWYQGHFPLRVSAWLRERRTGHPVLAFESSPYYLFHPLAPQRISAELPGIKIISLVRDPVERAYSAYTHEFARGFETESFERALELEPSRLAGEEAKLVADPSYHSHAHQHQAYVARGRYIDQITRMIQSVGQERVHIVDSDDFFTDPIPVWHEVLDFLGLPAINMPQFKRHNARPRTMMEGDTRTQLAKEFEDSDARLVEWWHRTPSWLR